MFFLKPRHAKAAKHLLHAAQKLLNYRRDILPPDRIVLLQEHIQQLKSALRTRDKKTILTATESLDAVCVKIAPPPANHAWRENVEVILVAVVIAIGVRAYFLQPFKIPTGSMQPTLNGIVGTPLASPPPAMLRQVAEYVWLGRNYINVVSESDQNEVLGLTELKRFHFFTFTRLTMSDGARTVYAPPATLAFHFGVRPGRVYGKGEVIARGSVDTGDQVLVDKVTFNFRHPKRGEVFVFKTTGIKRIEETLNPLMGSQFYIKRLVGLPGDQLRVEPPNLFINGAPAEEPMIRRVMSMADGYEGYSNHSRMGDNLGPPFYYLGRPDDVVEVPPHAYWAMGDNSYNSSDSRHWGIVPEQNVVGRGLFVYWPFSRHWGVIR